MIFRIYKLLLNIYQKFLSSFVFYWYLTFKDKLECDKDIETIYEGLIITFILGLILYSLNF